MGKGGQYRLDKHTYHRAYYVCSVPILLSEGESVPHLCEGHRVRADDGGIDEFSSFIMLTGMIGTSAFGVAWEVCQWSLVRLRYVD
ncbi:hypothetical protein P692DRAFT_20841735 [Suillus brevipes Sb2]|nr:hypothetical protein P692DRAFT_20841735 [Suillus brevipes Sb2]